MNPISFINQKVSFKSLQETSESENLSKDNEIHFVKMVKQDCDETDTFEREDSKRLRNAYGVEYDPDNLFDPNNPFNKDYVPPSSAIDFNA